MFRPGRQDKSSGLLPYTALHPATRGASRGTASHSPTRRLTVTSVNESHRESARVRASSVVSEEGLAVRRGASASHNEGRSVTASPIRSARVLPGGGRRGREGSPEPSPRRNETEVMQEIADRTCHKVKLWTVEEVRGVRAECAKLRTLIEEVREECSDVRTTGANTARFIAQEQNYRQELSIELTQKQHELRQWVADELARSSLSQSLAAMDSEVQSPASAASQRQTEERMRSLISTEAQTQADLLSKEKADREELSRQLASLTRSVDQQIQDLRSTFVEQMSTSREVLPRTDSVLEDMGLQVRQFQESLSSEKESRENGHTAMRAQLDSLEQAMKQCLDELSGRTTSLAESLAGESRRCDSLSTEMEKFKSVSDIVAGLPPSAQLSQLQERMAELEGQGSARRSAEGTLVEECREATSNLQLEVADLRRHLEEVCSSTRSDVQRHCEELVSECRSAVATSLEDLKQMTAEAEEKREATADSTRRSAVDAVEKAQEEALASLREEGVRTCTQLREVLRTSREEAAAQSESVATRECSTALDDAQRALAPLMADLRVQQDALLDSIRRQAQEIVSETCASMKQDPEMLELKREYRSAVVQVHDSIARALEDLREREESLISSFKAQADSALYEANSLNSIGATAQTQKELFQESCISIQSDLKRHCEDLVAECRLAVIASLDEVCHSSAPDTLQNSGTYGTLVEELKSWQEKGFQELEKKLESLQGQRLQHVQCELAEMAAALRNFTTSSAQAPDASWTSTSETEGAASALAMQRAVKAEEAARKNECREIRVQLEDVLFHLRLDKAFNNFLKNSAEPGPAQTNQNVSTATPSAESSARTTGHELGSLPLDVSLTSPTCNATMSPPAVQRRLAEWGDLRYARGSLGGAHQARSSSPERGALQPVPAAHHASLRSAPAAALSLQAPKPDVPTRVRTEDMFFHAGAQRANFFR